ncbi:MAG: hypothetical protein FWH36_02080 [Lentimicrobiaceae bacterium]|nr:hypothetical protein [Lentimicrobiaceae bacterium]
MKYRFWLGVGLFLVLFGLSCEKDFSVNAEYEDFPIVLGLIDAGNSTHYVKVYKSFVTENSAYDAAKDIHLYSYIDSVDVYMEERDAKGVLLRKIVFDTTTEIPKDSGIFAFPTQIIYKADAELNTNYSYKLFVYNRFTKKTAYSQPIPLVGNVTIRRPAGISFGISYSQFSVEYQSIKDVYSYEFEISFYYSEKMKDKTMHQAKPVVWNLGNRKLTAPVTGQETFSVSDGSIFFRRIASDVVENEDVDARYVDSIVLSVYAAGKDWYYYLLANLPSSGINQNRLDYSNISAYSIVENDTMPKYALGLFSSRSVSSKMFRTLVYPTTRDSLFYGMYTGHLKFTDIYY